MYLEMLYNRFNRTEDNSPMTKSAVANKAIRTLVKNNFSFYKLPSKEIPAGIRYSDLTIPLKERIARKFSRGPVEFSLKEPYKDYLTRVWNKDPRVARYAELSKKLARADDIRYRLDSSPNADAASQLLNDLNNSTEPYLQRALQGRIIPSVTVYKSKVPYATTHHLADGKASLAANKAAQNAKPGELLIENPNTKAGWKNYRGSEFRVNTPGATWSPEELELMRTSSNLSDTNLYETVFSHADRNFPNAIATYVPDTPEIRQTLALKPDVKGISIDDLQSKTQGTLYRGAHVSNSTAQHAYNSYKNVVRGYAPDRFKKSTDALWPTLPGATGAPERWFAPASRTSMGYAGANDTQKFIRLNSDALRRLREMRRLTSAPTSIPELEAYTADDWANMFRLRLQRNRITNIMERLRKQRDNTMSNMLYHRAQSFANT